MLLNTHKEFNESKSQVIIRSQISISTRQVQSAAKPGQDNGGRPDKWATVPIPSLVPLTNLVHDDESMQVFVGVFAFFVSWETLLSHGSIAIVEMEVLSSC